MHSEQTLTVAFGHFWGFFNSDGLNICQMFRVALQKKENSAFERTNNLLMLSLLRICLFVFLNSQMMHN